MTTHDIPPAVLSRLVALAYTLAGHDARPIGERPASLREQIDEANEIVDLIREHESEMAAEMWREMVSA